MTNLQPVWNWKVIKHLQEASKHQSYYLQVPGLVCALHVGVCVSQGQKIHLGRFSSPRGHPDWQTLHFSLSRQKRRVPRLDLPHFRDKVFLLDPRSRFRQTGAQSLRNEVEFSVDAKEACLVETLPAAN